MPYPFCSTVDYEGYAPEDMEAVRFHCPDSCATCPPPLPTLGPTASTASPTTPGPTTRHEPVGPALPLCDPECNITTQAPYSVVPAVSICVSAEAGQLHDYLTGSGR